MISNEFAAIVTMNKREKYSGGDVADDILVLMNDNSTTPSVDNSKMFSRPFAVAGSSLKISLLVEGEAKGLAKAWKVMQIIRNVVINVTCVCWLSFTAVSSRASSNRRIDMINSMYSRNRGLYAKYSDPSHIVASEVSSLKSFRFLYSRGAYKKKGIPMT